jgi:glycosyltransferase involved in cell wall biosynthesis
VIRAVAYFGTYDPDYPRSAVVIAGLRELGVAVYEVRAPLPDLKAAEMATVRGAATLAGALTGAHVRLARQLQGRVPVDALVVGYPGHLMVPLGRAVAGLLRAPLVFDPLVSLWDTFADDRGLVGRSGLPARAVRAVDAAAFRLPDLVLADTGAHAGYYRSAFGLPEGRLAVVPVGALPEPAADGTCRSLLEGEPLTVFQYGKWSPLHGADVVIAAAEMLRDEPFRFVLAGEGQLSAPLRADIAARRLTNVEWLGSLTAGALRTRTLAADVCLGVFGSSAKAARVVPNKVFDGLACGRPVVTADTPGVRELLTQGEDALLVPAADPAALGQALRSLRDPAVRGRLGTAALTLYRRSLTPEAVAGRVVGALEGLRGR